MAAERYMTATGTTSASVAIPNGVEPNTLVVIDFVAAAGGGGLGSHSVAIEGTQIGLRPQATTPTGWEFVFHGGYPVWSASNTDGAVGTGVTVDITNGGGSACYITAGFHYERPSTRRTAGQ